MQIQLFKVSGQIGNTIIGLSYDQIVALNSAPTLIYGAEDMREKLDYFGELTAWKFAMIRDRHGRIMVTPIAALTLNATQIDSIEPIRGLSEVVTN